MKILVRFMQWLVTGEQERSLEFAKMSWGEMRKAIDELPPVVVRKENEDGLANR